MGIGNEGRGVSTPVDGVVVSDEVGMIRVRRVVPVAVGLGRRLDRTAAATLETRQTSVP